VSGLNTSKHARLATVVVPPTTFPPVVNPVVVPGTMHNICVPVTGGVMVLTAVLPERIVRNVVGAIVAAAVNVTGFG
jgi:hypothetical protein